MQLLEIFSGMANSVDPDQTAPSGAVWSGSALFAYVILSDTKVYKILGQQPLPYFVPNLALIAYIFTMIVNHVFLQLLPLYCYLLWFFSFSI